MKKIIIVLFVLMLCNGCSIQNNDNSPKNSIFLTIIPSIDDIIPNEDFMNGDFSTIAGDYINVNNEVITIDDEGLQGNELVNDTDINFFKGIYQMNVADQYNQGYSLTIYPVGIEIQNCYVTGDEIVFYDTDITKVRISHGQADPMSIEEIYTKK